MTGSIQTPRTVSVASQRAAAEPGSAPAKAGTRTVSRRKSLGQGMTEYIVIVALVGVAAIGVYSFLGQSVRGATAGIALEISGKSGKDGIDTAQTASNQALSTARRKTSLGNYHEGNNH